VAQALARMHADVLAVEAAELHRRQVDWCSEQAADFQEYMRRVRDPEFTTSGAWPIR
jgi:DNA polymerase-3 subunit epsilon